MSYRVHAMGLDRELAKKINDKYSEDDEEELMEWIIAVLSDCPNLKYPEGQGKKHFQAWLKDGILLCELINKLFGRVVCRHTINTDRIKFGAMRKNKEMDNIGMFLKAINEYGVETIDLFQTVCLYESTNLAQVHATLYKLGSAAQANNFDGPVIGVKIAKKNERNFKENTLREGRSVIGLQMGTNQVASQQGMTPYGLGRQLVTKKA